MGAADQVIWRMCWQVCAQKELSKGYWLLAWGCKDCLQVLARAALPFLSPACGACADWMWLVAAACLPACDRHAALACLPARLLLLQGLESMGRISGVMDERGKFIYISREEMQSVAAHIRSKGRVSIAALAAASNNLIDLEAKTGVEVVAAGGGATTGPMIDFDSMLDA